MKIWRLKKGGDIRFRQGHPWIFSGELAHSSRDVDPGEVVELRDSADHFLAYGMAHPSSNICFRKLSGRSKDDDVLSVDFFLRRFEQARALRRAAGYTDVSHRWIFAEVDGLPGLIADVFRGEEDVVVFQISTAGMDRAKNELLTAFEKFGIEALIEASTSSQRKNEGLKPLERSQSRAVDNLAHFPIHLRHMDQTLTLHADLAGGQKTGFFLDQQANTNLLLQLLSHQWREGDGELRVLDLCTYVGQWSAQMAFLAKRLSRQLQVDLVDQSEQALALAKENVEAFGASANLFSFDVMEAWPEAIAEGKYDVVICDPPGFVKKKTDFSKGKSAYVRLNREALKRVKTGGLIVTSSCSGAIQESDFADCLNAAKSKAGRSVKWLAHGGHGPDHPILLEFPEGRYLKCWIGQVDFPI